MACSPGRSPSATFRDRCPASAPRPCTGTDRAIRGAHASRRRPATPPAASAIDGLTGRGQLLGWKLSTEERLGPRPIPQLQRPVDLGAVSGLDLFVDLDPQFVLDVMRVGAEEQDPGSFVVEEGAVVSFDPSPLRERVAQMLRIRGALGRRRKPRHDEMGILDGEDVAGGLLDLELFLRRSRLSRQFQCVRQLAVPAMRNELIPPPRPRAWPRRPAACLVWPSGTPWRGTRGARPRPPRSSAR